MANDVIINGQTYSGMDAVNLMKTDGTTETYYPDAVRYVSQTLTDEQKAQARANIGVTGTGEGSDNVLVVTQENDVASHSSTEIKAARDAGKAVFLLYSKSVFPITSFEDDTNAAVFDDYLFVTNRGYFLHTKYSIGADKKITVTQDDAKVSDFVGSGSDVLIVDLNGETANYSRSEIEAAFTEGKIVVGKYGHYQIPYCATDTVDYMFQYSNFSIYVIHTLSFYVDEDKSIRKSEKNYNYEKNFGMATVFLASNGNSDATFEAASASPHKKHMVIFDSDNSRYLSRRNIQEDLITFANHEVDSETGTITENVIEVHPDDTFTRSTKTIVVPTVADVLAALPTWTGGSY